MTSLRKKSYIVTTVLVVALFALLRILIDAKIITRTYEGVLILIAINIILTVSLNITVGLMGQINLGHAGFMSVGAYAAALFMKAGILEGVPGYLVSLVIGGVVAAIFGIIIGIPVLRLKGDYLAIVTLAFGEIIRVLIEYFDFTGGAQGLRGIPRFKDFNVIYFVMVICVFLMYTMMTSRHGREVLAIREDEIASSAAGVNVTYAKSFAFAFSAFFAGVAGAMYGQNLGILSAKAFDFNFSINILVMVVLGGMGSFTGATISAILLTLLPELLREFASYRMIVYALLLIVMMIFRPSGLLGRKEIAISKIIQRLSPDKEKEASL